MGEDDIIETIRAIRDEHAHRFKYDLDAICNDLREQEANCGHQVVSRPPKRVLPSENPKRGEQAA